MVKIQIVMILVSMFVAFAQTVWSAQSSADIPVTEEILKEARSKVLGNGKQGIYSDAEYVVGHGDVLSVQVYGEGDMSLGGPTASRAGKAEDDLRGAAGGVSVRIDGRISLRHIGDIEAVGFTLSQLADYLKELYSTVFGDPIVTVVLVQSNSQRYTVMGKVQRPGIYYLDYPINIVQVVARCGGFTEWAKTELTLVRNNPQKDRQLFKGNTLKFDYDDFLDGEKLEKNILVQAGDIIIVH